MFTTMDVFEALADSRRREVVQLVGERPRRAGELSAATGMAPSAMSRHLRILLDAGLVEDERGSDDARARVFRLRAEGLVAVEAFLDQVQADWRVQLGAFAAHVEHRRSREDEG
jgi:DNA-binding transcriptional ArsR family regulator